MAAFILILLMGVLAVMVLSVISSRIILAIGRGKSLSDDLITSYEAESKINDTLGRLVYQWGNITFPFSQTHQIDPTTKVTINGNQEDNTQIVTVIVSRPYAVNQIEARRVNVSSQVNVIAPQDIILVLDCTGSMNSPARPGGTTTRFDELKSAALAFVGAAWGMDVKIGVVVYGIDAAWLRGSDGVEVTPTDDLDRVGAALNYGFNSTRNSSPACGLVNDYTSIGSGFVKAHEYFAIHKTAGRKQIEVLVTDGLPNSRMPYSACFPGYFCPEGGGYCSTHPNGWSCVMNNGSPISGTACNVPSRDFLRCTLAGNNEVYDSELDGISRAGVKDPSVDVYAVTVLEDPSDGGEPGAVEKFTKTVAVFNRYSKKYYNSSDATQLTEILQSFLDDIIHSSSTITIRRVIPTI